MTDYPRFDDASDLWDEITERLVFIDDSMRDEMGISPNEGLAHLCGLLAENSHLLMNEWEALKKALPAIGIYVRD